MVRPAVQRSNRKQAIASVIGQRRVIVVTR